MEELKNNSAPPIQMDQNNDNFFYLILQFLIKIK